MVGDSAVARGFLRSRVASRVIKERFSRIIAETGGNRTERRGPRSRRNFLASQTAGTSASVKAFMVVKSVEAALSNPGNKRKIDQLYSACLFIKARSSSVNLPSYLKIASGMPMFPDIAQERRDFELAIVRLRKLEPDSLDTVGVYPNCDGLVASKSPLGHRHKCGCGLPPGPICAYPIGTWLWLRRTSPGGAGLT